MAGIVYGIPYIPPAPPESPWTGMPMTWTGWDGSVWNLCNGAEGVVLQAGVRGFGQAPYTHWRDKSPAVPGAKHNGEIADEREVFWPIKVYSDASSREWVERDRAFWRTLQPSRTGVWTVTHPDGAKRSLTLRVASDGDPSFDTIPSLQGWAKYGITLVADQPYWEGQPIFRTWAQFEQQPFLPPTAGAGYTVSSGSPLETATITNPGDVETHLRWEITGPCTSVTVGAGGAMIIAPVTLDAGETMVIDTDPDEQAATIGDTDVTKQLTKAEFTPIPPGESVKLSLFMEGTGTIRAELTPLYERAW
jgi:hypothetical protein